jgi:hypothetical protein
MMRAPIRSLPFVSLLCAALLSACDVSPTRPDTQFVTFSDRQAAVR